MPGPAAPPFADLLGVRSSKGRYYQEYRHSRHDLERTLMAVNAVSWVLADAPGDARSLVDSTLPVIAQLLGARAVVLVSEHPALGGARVCVRSLHPGDAGPLDQSRADLLVQHAERLSAASPPTGLLRFVPELGSTLLLAPLPRSGRRDGYVVASARRPRARPDATDLAILGTLTNQLAGAIESCWRLAESEVSRRAASDALREADAQALALERRNELLKQARYDLVAAREDQVLAAERQRIARDLHDSVAQHVLSMGMQVEWCRTACEQPDVVERLTDVKELARSAVDRIRQAIFELSGTDELQPGGLPAALRRLGEQHRGHGLGISVRVRGALALPRAVEHALYMVAKEALFNTVLHAEATRAGVHLLLGRSAVRLQVSDDGVGTAAHLQHCLRQAQRHGSDGYHRGLPNLQERARQVGGTLAIADLRPRGVRLQVTVPLEPDDAPHAGGRR